MSLLNDLERLGRLHDEQLALAKSTLGLARKSDLDALDDLWARRRRLFKSLQEAHNRLLPAFGAWEGALEPLGRAQADRARALVEGMDRCGRQTLDLDRQSAQLLAGARDDLAGELRKLSDGRRLRRAYDSGGRGETLPLRLSRTG